MLYYGHNTSINLYFVAAMEEKDELTAVLE